MTRVLLLDDSLTILKVVRLTFASTPGYEVDVAKTEADARTQLERAPPDVVVGYARFCQERTPHFFEEIRKRCPHVLVLTESNENTGAFESAGFRRFLKKPFHSEELRKAVAEFVGSPDFQDGTGEFGGSEFSTATDEPTRSVKPGTRSAPPPPPPPMTMRMQPSAFEEDRTIICAVPPFSENREAPPVISTLTSPPPVPPPSAVQAISAMPPLPVIPMPAAGGIPEITMDVESLERSYRATLSQRSAREAAPVSAAPPAPAPQASAPVAPAPVAPAPVAPAPVAPVPVEAPVPVAVAPIAPAPVAPAAAPPRATAPTAVVAPMASLARSESSTSNVAEPKFTLTLDPLQAAPESAAFGSNEPTLTFAAARDEVVNPMVPKPDEINPFAGLFDSAGRRGKAGPSAGIDIGPAPSEPLELENVVLNTPRRSAIPGSSRNRPLPQGSQTQMAAVSHEAAPVRADVEAMIDDALMRALERAVPVKIEMKLESEWQRLAGDIAQRIKPEVARELQADLGASLRSVLESEVRREMRGWLALEAVSLAKEVVREEIRRLLEES